VATTTGFVQRLTWAPTKLCTWVGPSVTSAELFFELFSAFDSEALLGFKRNIGRLLAQAKNAGYQVSIEHSDHSAEIVSASLLGFNISPLGDAIHNDFYSVTGSGIPADVRVVFDNSVSTITVTPDLVRPHWVLIASLPPSIPVGRNNVRLEGSGYTSDWVPVDVSAGPAVTVRVLYTGQPKDQPYNVVFVANPAIRTEAGTLIADPVRTNRPSYQDTVGYALRNLLTVTEDLLRQGAWDAQFRFVSVFDTVPGVTDANALAQEDNPNIMETRRDKLNAFVSQYSERADIVFVMHGSTSHDRASAWFTSDDAAKAGTAYTYDGVARTHGHFQATPGSAALPLDMDRTGLTPLHEYGHAGSDFDNGRVTDLYVDGVSGFNVNKKARASSSNPIPTNFATYNGTIYASDQNRDGLGYPPTWTSYHPQLVDAAHPNLMDNYWLAAGGNPQVCRLDGLTYAWYTDRLRAKLNR
jgi:hypothetical protein